MHVFELRDRIMTLPALEARMAAIQNDLQKENERVAVLLKKYEQESGDVLRLQKESLSAFLLRLVGKYEDKLEKEQREEINAKLNLDRATAHLKSLEIERDALASRIAALRLEEQAYHAELESRRLKLATNMQYVKLEEERRNIITQITKIEEAQEAVAQTQNTAHSLLDSLESAQGWATFDAFTRGGILTHMAKYGHIDSACEKFNTLSNQLQDLCTELNDVQSLTIPSLNEISSGQRAIDLWFDNIFTNLSVRGKIVDNANQIRQLISNLNAASTTLEQKLEEAEKDFENNKKQEERLLLSSQ